MSSAAVLDDSNAFAVVSDPAWFPVDLDLRSETFDFVQTGNDELAAEAFVSLASWKPRGPRRRLSIARTLANWPDRPPPAINFIWHTAYCASTLVSRVFDVPGRNLSLREPDVLAILANVKRARLLGEARFRRLPQTVFGLFGRPLAEGSAMMIKPTPATNVLIPEAAQLTTGKHLFLYADCKSFLIAVARGGETRRGFARSTFSAIAADGHMQNNWPVAQLFAMADLQIAALVWHMHMAQMRRSIAALGDRAMSLDCDVFLKAPEQTIARLDAFFGLGFGAAYAKQVAEGPLLRRHAKSGKDIAGPWAQRMQEHDLDAQFARDIDTLVKWSYQTCKTPAGGLPRPLETTQGLPPP